MIVAVISVISLVSSSATYSAVGGSQITEHGAASSVPVGDMAATADCSSSTARQLVEDKPNPVAQQLCGAFTGPGSEAMAIAIAAPTCWVVFSFSGGAWQLVLDESEFIFPLVGKWSPSRRARLWRPPARLAVR